ncbi:MAG: hypothetical protein ACJ73J_12335 [Actinomycetes bacterium]
MLATWAAILLAGYIAASVLLLTYLGYDRVRFPLGTIVSGYLLVGGTLLLVAMTPAFATSGRSVLADSALPPAKRVLCAWGRACHLAAAFVIVLAVFVIACLPLGGTGVVRLLVGVLAVAVVLGGVLAIQMGIVASVRRRWLGTALGCAASLVLLLGPVTAAPAIKAWTADETRGCTDQLAPGGLAEVTGCTGMEPFKDAQQNPIPTWWIVATQPALIVADATPWALVSEHPSSAYPLANGLDPQTVLSSNVRAWRHEDAEPGSEGWSLEETQTWPATWSIGLALLYGTGALLLLLGAVRVRRNGVGAGPSLWKPGF